MQNLSINNTKVLGKNIKWYKELDSTQKEIHRLIANNKIENGMLVGCDFQTNGIGTHGRKWFSTNGNLTFSFYYELNKNVSEVGDISVEIANIIKEVFLECFNQKIDIIYPNDLFINGKKFGGILVESSILNNIIKYIVVCIGLNNLKSKIDASIEKISTSYLEEFGEVFDERLFLNTFFEKFEEKCL